MRVFSRVVELGSFSAAARESRVSQPTVSKSIASLEKQLGVRLLDRSTSRVVITGEGKRFYERTRYILEEYVDAVAEARGQSLRVSGKLRISAPVGFGELWLNRLCVDFLRLYPEAEVELLLTDRYIDLIEEGADIAVRLGDYLPPNVVARKIATSPRVLVASPAYLSREGSIERPSDLTSHRYLRFAGLSADPVIFLSRDAQAVSVVVAGNYSVNNSLALRQCFVDGIGVGSAPAWLVGDLVDSGQLVQLLSDWDMPSQDVHLVYVSRRLQPERVKTCISFLSEHIKRIHGLQISD